VRRPVNLNVRLSAHEAVLLRVWAEASDEIFGERPNRAAVIRRLIREEEARVNERREAGRERRRAARISSAG
jgi:hypothetical protein